MARRMALAVNGGGLSLLDEDIEDGADVFVAAGAEAERVRVAVDD